MITLSATGADVRRLLDLRINRLERTVELLRLEAAAVAKEREAETERAELFLKLFPPGDPQPDIYMFPRSPGAVVGDGPSLVSRAARTDEMIAREIAECEHALEIERWMFAQVREGDVYELDREDLAFLAFGTMRFAHRFLV